MMTTFNQQLGPLRSEITFTLHTQYATRLWNGRDLVKNDNGDVIISSILSIPSALSLLSQIQQDAEQDDPYADDYLLRFEQKVMRYRQEMQEMTWRMVNHYSEKIPENFQIERCANITPIQYPIFVNTQLGYQLLYLLADFDSLARTVMTASHIAILTKADASDWLDAGAKLLRKCFGVIENYKHAGITRKDAAENNARYQAAVKRMKYTLPPEILSGTVRANYAPIIKTPSQDSNASNNPAVELESVEVQVSPQKE
ncbi:conjugal transfer protein [Aggregatibacter aphrophilus NJ8700]|uniref:PFL_4669 family integrating conjugative element protein n=1 Tax=Aggregatibacter TaxID=416916 RepID=UPI0005196CB1|nr:MULTISPECIES: TIGR03761 family integrating conjugative element protein [Aggregatibacter]AKS64741.1 conjugal transfer protein [Aggregatibacter aphrophilus NJ8700]